jgi:glycerophosphoryl diester phosphodiesterase
MASFVKVAHRGASGSFPENTRLAFEKAIEAGADMIELDCQLTQDGHVVVFHDERLLRTARARGKVRDKTLEQLKRLDIGKWKKRAFHGETILTLEEALEIIDGRTHLCIDIKQFPDSQSGIEIKLLFIVSRYDYLDQTIFSSFDYACLGRIRELAPETHIGLIYGAGVHDDPFVVAQTLKAASIHVQKEFATREFLSRAWEAGLDVHVWTVNDLREMQNLASIGVQGLVSDFPERFSKLFTYSPKSHRAER